MAEFRKFIPNSIIKEVKISDKNIFLTEIKKRYLKQIKGRSGGRTFLRRCAKKHGFRESKAFELLLNFYKLSGTYYLICNFLTSKMNHQILIPDEDTNNINIPNNLLSDIGLPIWEKDISLKPKLWNVFEEEKNKHLFFSFIHKAPEIKFFDPIMQKFQKIYSTAIINYRVHLDHSVIIETSSKNSSEKKIELSLIHLKKILNINNLTYKKITDQNIRDFDIMAKQVTFEKREGITATASLTRANRNKDTRKSVLREELNEREFRKEHGVIHVNSNNYIISLARGKKGIIQIKQCLAPQEQIKLMHEIFKILKWITL